MTVCPNDLFGDYLYSLALQYRACVRLRGSPRFAKTRVIAPSRWWVGLSTNQGSAYRYISLIVAGDRGSIFGASTTYLHVNSRAAVVFVKTAVTCTLQRNKVILTPLAAQSRNSSSSTCKTAHQSPRPSRVDSRRASLVQHSGRRKTVLASAPL
ncbi:hypothetical protein BCR34DRAFT_46398 [Clohesyomyces aquaticus]|uniref:Uncharacterized protein n=1 Tax=Clohesyomyces aquaticus TaxID=1231657 RepID=A0A1Y1Z4T2_9PLEO|nr:hypothetical protein BCR34DRAFT_46398 [Clohesyomyces aquaticus]